MFDALIPALRAALKARAEGHYARLGKLEANGTYTIVVPGKPNYVYVRLGGQTALVQEALNLRVQVRPDLPVRVRRNEAGEWEVLDVYPSEASTALGASAAAMNIPPADGDTVQQTTAGRNFKPGRVRPGDQGALSVYVEPFDYYVGATRVHFGGGVLDLTPYRPSTPGHWAWVQIYVDVNTNALAAAAGTERPLRALLTQADRAGINIGSNVPVDAVILQQGQTQAPVEGDFYFSRVVFNRAEQVGGSGGNAEVLGWIGWWS